MTLYIFPECGASTLHSPVAMPMVASGQWSPVVSSGLQWSRCDLLHFYRPVIRHTASTTAHHHTGISWAYGDWVIFCLFHKICVPLIPVDLRQSPPAPVLAGVSGVQSTNKPPPGHCIINLLSAAPAAAFLVIKAGESFVFERYF